MIDLQGMAGSVTAITGFEKGSGKTTFLGHALPILRKSGPVALFTIGVDGAQKARETQALPPEIRVEPGDLAMTTQPFAKLGTARFEVLEALPGRSSLGHLFLGRAVRGGSVTLVGSDHLPVLAGLVERVRSEGLAHSVLVDGAVNRLTQVRALGPVGFVFTARVDPANLQRTALHLRNLAALAALPVESEPAGDALRLEGVVNAEILATLPPGVSRLSIEDFTKIFLESGQLARSLERYAISVRHAFRLHGFAVSLRGVDPKAFHEALGPKAAALLLPNPCEAA